MKIADLDFEAVLTMLAAGETQVAIARKFKVSDGDLSVWLADDKRSARAREARAKAAALWDDRATAVIEEASDPFELAKAKELAHHYRWRASKIAPKVYGDKVAVTDPDGGPMTVVIKRLTDA